VLAHLKECVVQIRGEFLPNPDDGLPMMPERFDERVDGCDKARALLG
jgi:hypothetical protein